MKKAAIVLAPGFEEGEALFVVDIIRRGGFEACALGLGGETVTGAHAITVCTDAVFSGSLAEFDLVVLPGGMGGALAMRDDEAFQAALKEAHAQGKLIAAICAAPLALDRAGLLDGRTYTCYPTTAEKICAAGATWKDEIVVYDDNFIFSQGPGTTLDFAYALVDALGGDGSALSRAMLYEKVRAR